MEDKVMHREIQTDIHNLNSPFLHQKKLSLVFVN